MCVLISSINFAIFLVLIRMQRDIIINVLRLVINYSLFLSDFMNLGFSQQIFGKLVIYQIEYPSSGSRVVPFGQTDITKPTVAVRNFANAPKNNNGL